MINPAALANLQAAAKQFDELCGDDEQLFHDMMEGETDVDRIVLRIHEAMAQSGEMLVGIKDRQDALAARKKRIETRRDNAKALIGRVLRAAGLPKLELAEVTYSVRDGKPKLSLADPKAVPDDLTRIERKPDMAAIKSAFESADDLPNWLAREPATDVVTARTK